MVKHNKQVAPDEEEDNEEEMIEVEFQNELIRVIKELKSEKMHVNTLEDDLKTKREQVLNLKIKDKGMFIYQTKYNKEMLKKFHMEDCKPVLTPMVTCRKLSLENSSEDVEKMLYRSIIGSILYVTASRPDVMWVVGLVARLQEAPKESHILAIKRILRYLKGTMEYGLWYPKGTDLFIQAYTDVDCVASVDDHKITSGATFYLGCCLVSWLSKSSLQSCYPQQK
eukprot:PITA_16166